MAILEGSSFPVHPEEVAPWPGKRWDQPRRWSPQLSLLQPHRTERHTTTTITTTMPGTIQRQAALGDMGDLVRRIHTLAATGLP